MLNNIKYFIAGFLLLLFLTNIASGQNSNDSLFHSFGIDVGYFSTLGDWKKHRYAVGVDQFQGSFNFGAELETKLLNAGIGFLFSYSKLSVEDWEKFAQHEGDQIDASASMVNLGILLKLYLLTEIPQMLNLDVGVCYIFSEGHETFETYSYDYNFLKSGIGFITGMGYKHLLNKKIALVFNVRCLIKPDGIKYADGKSYTVIGLPLTLGIRYFF